MQSIQNNRFSVLFGIKNPTNTQVSPALEALGIRMLRQAPSDTNLDVIRIYDQTGYCVYKHNLPAYMRAFYEEKPRSLLNPLVGLPRLNWDELITFGLPEIICDWSFPLPDEVADALRTNLDAQDARDKNNKPAMVFPKLTPLQIPTLRETNPNNRTPAPFGLANIGCIPVVKVCYTLLNLFSRLQQYSSAIDSEHAFSIEMMKRQAVEGDNTDAEMEVAELPDHYVQSITHGGTTIRCSGPQAATHLGPSTVTYPEYSSQYDATRLACGGLFFPYISELAAWDKKKVPSVISRYFQGCLGETVEDVEEMIEMVRREFGVLGHTEWGKEMTHAFTCMGLAIESQSKLWLVIDEGVYLGAVLEGTGFSLFCNREEFQPGSRDQLIDAVAKGGNNMSVLAKIGQYVRGEGDEVVNFTDVNRMWKLRRRLEQNRVRGDDKEEIIKLAKQLRFRDDISWKPIVDDIVRSGEYLSDNYRLNEYSEDENLPITATALFSDDKEFVIWSCFGYVAPSFRIPGGTLFDLRSVQNVVTRNVGGVRGGQSVSKEKLIVSKIHLRVVDLELAVRDLKDMIREKTILNPFATPVMRRSNEARFKMFTGQGMNKVVAALRDICRVGTVATRDENPNKRGAGVEIGSSSKKRRLDDYF
jgi:hypothetical protein